MDPKDQANEETVIESETWESPFDSDPDLMLSDEELEATKAGADETDAPAEDEAEEAEADETTAEDSTGDDDGEGEPSGGSEGTMPDEPIPTVPVSALVAERKKSQKLAEQLAYLQGQTDARKVPEPEKAPEPTPQEQIATLRRELIDAAGKLKNGEIEPDEYEQLRFDTDDKIAAVREAAAAAERQAQAWTPEQLVAHPRVIEESGKLEANNPWLSVVPDVAFDGAQAEAMRRLQAHRIDPNTPDGTITLQATVVRVLAESGFARNSATPQPAPAKPAPDTAKAEQKTKKLAKQQPPPLAGVGEPSGVDDSPFDGLSFDQMTNMSDDQIAKAKAGNAA